MRKGNVKNAVRYIYHILNMSRQTQKTDWLDVLLNIILVLIVLTVIYFLFSKVADLNRNSLTSSYEACVRIAPDKEPYCDCIYKTVLPYTACDKLTTPAQIFMLATTTEIRVTTTTKL